MYDIRKNAKEILDAAQNTYRILDDNNPDAISKTDPRSREDFWKSLFYFESDDIDGAIICEENEYNNEKNVYVISTIKYINRDNNSWWFAKIRIYEDKYDGIQIKGKRTGYCFDEDFYDVDFLKEPDAELDIVLEAMKSSILPILEEVNKNVMEAPLKYEPKWVKSVKLVSPFGSAKK